MADRTQLNEVPAHIGFIMDGNRRWAKQKGLHVLEGYQEGGEALKRILAACVKNGVKIATVYAFSTENWRRPDEEKSGLMRLFEKTLVSRLAELNDLGVKVKFIGRVGDFSEKLQKTFRATEEKTKDNEALILNVAVSYGGRAEIVDAVKKIIEKGVKPEEVTEELISANIYEAGLPEPELIVRASAEPRISGFMLWQSVYSELYFTKTLWPDFNEVELEKAIEYYLNIKRNFGR